MAEQTAAQAAGHTTGRLHKTMSGAAALALLCGAAIPAAAEGGFLSMGVGGGPEDLWTWQSVSWAPWSGIDETGLVLRAAVRGENKSYVTELPGRPDARIWAQGIGADAEAGWQYVADWGRISALAGVAWRDYMLSPSDPNSSLASNDFGARFTLEGQYTFAQGLGAFGYGEYITGFDQWFVQVRPYMELESGLKIGPEFSLGGGEDYLHTRAGLFVTGYEVELPWVGLFWLGASAGARIDAETAEVAPYAGVHFSRRINGF